MTLTWHRARGALALPPLRQFHGRAGRLPAMPGPPSPSLRHRHGAHRGDARGLIPRARVARLDRDTLRAPARRTHPRDWHEGTLDVLVGTQMVTKGHDVPGVTLVGVVAPTSRSTSPTFAPPSARSSCLTQVAGRAGRGDRPGACWCRRYRPTHYAAGGADPRLRRLASGELRYGARSAIRRSPGSLRPLRRGRRRRSSRRPRRRGALFASDAVPLVRRAHPRAGARRRSSGCGAAIAGSPTRQGDDRGRSPRARARSARAGDRGATRRCDRSLMWIPTGCYDSSSIRRYVHRRCSKSTRTPISS